MADENKNNVALNNLMAIFSPDNLQKYVLGTKKNGAPRAIYDVVKDYTKPKKGKKKKKKNKKKNKNSVSGTYALYLETKKKHKKKKKDKYWHI